MHDYSDPKSSIDNRDVFSPFNITPLMLYQNHRFSLGIGLEICSSKLVLNAYQTINPRVVRCSRPLLSIDKYNITSRISHQMTCLIWDYVMLPWVLQVEENPSPQDDQNTGTVCY